MLDGERRLVKLRMSRSRSKMPGSHRHSSALSWVVRRVVCWSQIQTNGEVVVVGAEYFGEEVEQKGRRGQRAQAQVSVLVLVLDVL
jgi:hypothetical protein